jgi:hypothetical protein
MQATKYVGHSLYDRGVHSSFTRQDSYERQQFGETDDRDLSAADRDAAEWIGENDDCLHILVSELWQTRCQIGLDCHGPSFGLLAVTLHRTALHRPIVAVADDVPSHSFCLEHENAARANNDMVNVAASQHEVVDEEIVVGEATDELGGQVLAEPAFSGCTKVPDDGAHRILRVYEYGDGDNDRNEMDGGRPGSKSDGDHRHEENCETDDNKSYPATGLSRCQVFAADTKNLHSLEIAGGLLSPLVCCVGAMMCNASAGPAV